MIYKLRENGEKQIIEGHPWQVKSRGKRIFSCILVIHSYALATYATAYPVALIGKITAVKVLLLLL